jgi:hypothetical protein
MTPPMLPRPMTATLFPCEFLVRDDIKLQTFQKPLLRPTPSAVLAEIAIPQMLRTPARQTALAASANCKGVIP